MLHGLIENELVISAFDDKQVFFVVVHMEIVLHFWLTVCVCVCVCVCLSPSHPW